MTGGPAVAGVAIISALATVLSWRWLAWRPVMAGLNSWQAGITLGFVDHVQWGPQLVFTFGPYGFLEDILPYAHLTAALGLVYALAVTWGLAALMVSALRRSWGLLAAGVAAWVALAIAANLVEAPELGTATALGLALASLRAAGRGRLALLAVLGAFAGLAMLVEIDVGLVATLVAVLAVAGRSERRRGLASAGVPYLGALLIAQVAAGQSLANFPSYLRGSLSVLFGYAPAMGLSSNRGAENWFAVVDVALLLVVYALALRGCSRVEKVVTFAALAGWGWEAFKEGFVRHDKHDLIFFSLVLVALCLARVSRRALLQAAAIAVAAVVACIANGAPPRSMGSPLEDATALAREVGDVALPGRWAPVERTARAQVRATGDALPAGLLAELEGHTFAAAPLEDALSFAYPGLRWRPEPVVQGYSAYTTYLDQLDARFLASPRAPDIVLYRPGPIDGRNPAWDPPATVEAMYCYYVPVAGAAPADDAGWLVLTRVADRCGAPRLIGRARAHFGQVVPVPAAPGQMVVATFSLTSPLSADVEGAVLKPPIVGLTAGTAEYRFITGTAADSHVLFAPASLRYPAGFAPDPIHQLELSGGGWAPGHGSVVVTFYAVGLAR